MREVAAKDLRRHHGDRDSDDRREQAERKQRCEKPRIGPLELLLRFRLAAGQHLARDKRQAEPSYTDHRDDYLVNRHDETAPSGANFEREKYLSSQPDEEDEDLNSPDGEHLWPNKHDHRL